MLTTENSDLITSNDQQIKELNVKDSKIKELQKNIFDGDIDINRLKGKLDVFQTELSKTEQAHAKSASELLLATERAGAVGAENILIKDALKEARLDLDTKKKEWEGERNSLGESLEKANELITTLQSELSKKGYDVELLNKDLKQLNNEYQHDINRRVMNEEKLQQAQKEIEETRKQMKMHTMTSLITHLAKHWQSETPKYMKMLSQSVIRHYI